MTEREQYSEKESLWKSRLFKMGFVMAVVGSAARLSELAIAGVTLAGISWAFWKGNRK